MLELSIAAAAFVFAALALVRAYVPPQQRDVREILLRVSELENDYTALADRLTARQRKEGMAIARTAHESRAARRDAVEQHALSIIEQQQAAPAPAPADREAVKRQLRAQFLKQH